MRTLWVACINMQIFARLVRPSRSAHISIHNDYIHIIAIVGSAQLVFGVIYHIVQTTKAILVCVHVCTGESTRAHILLNSFK
jgi:hypothetical protein